MDCKSGVALRFPPQSMTHPVCPRFYSIAHQPSPDFNHTLGCVTEITAQSDGHGVTLEISQTQGVWFGVNKMFRRGATMDTARVSTVLSGQTILATMTSHVVAG